VIVYLDSSVVLRVLLNQLGALDSWGEWDAAFSSELLSIESRRVIDRLRLEGRIDDEDVAQAHDELRRVEETLGIILLTRTIFRRAAAPMPTIVRTLDAMHLASAVVLRDFRDEPLTFATHDQQQATAARALGFDCVGV
jgi:hypothetical protein